MWTTHCDKVNGGRGLRFQVESAGRSMTYAEVLHQWQYDADFRSFFLKLLADAPFASYRWETPPLTQATTERLFEFVLLDSPELIRRPDLNAFAEHFSDAALKGSVVEFANLGRDAILIVPCPQSVPSAYGHLAAFIRHAPEQQQHALWQLVGEAMERQLNSSPVWLSTAGAGVPWLHVRLDNRPKYYGYGPYTVSDFT